MPPQPDLFDLSPVDGDAVTLAHYAERAYLDYALSVVKGRALPDVCDGQKPVQRRILFSMQRMGLAPTAVGGGPRPVKAARVVGDVLGRFHPHGDQAAYDALVRMAQPFAQRYPLVDGQGNFGSRDGDSAAAMRYTEARLTPIARLLTDELDEGTADFVPNYDGSAEEPRRLPGRLPFVLLNGASGIAVGLATEIPSHHLGEVAAAAVALLKNGALDDAGVAALLPGPDYPGGGQIISSAEDIRAAYASGRGTLKVRARWHREDLARGQWQIVVDELPPATSTQKVLEDIEELVNPKLRAGKKALTAEQLQLKATLLAVLDTVRDESDKNAPVRLVFEPKSSRIDAEAFVRTLLAHTSLEGSSPLNLTLIGADGRPAQKSLRQMLVEWIAFRRDTVLRRSRHRLERLQDRIHVLEGRQTVLLNIDEVIAIIRDADEPKAALIARFALSERQADDILDIRLRQLARLEAIRIEQELVALRRDAEKLADIVDSPASLQRTVVREIEADAKQHGDARRTLIQPERRASAEVVAVDEPVTVVVSDKGWVRTAKGHEIDPAALPFKQGDGVRAGFACRSVDPLLVFGSPAGASVRVYTVAVATLPGGRGDGQPLSSMIELERGTHPAQYWAGPVSQVLLLVSDGGHGLLARVGDMASRQRAGKAFFTLDEGEALLPLVPADHAGAAADAEASVGTAGVGAHSVHQVACLTRSGRLLVFGLDELKLQGNGGRGLTLVDLPDGDALASVVIFSDVLRVHGSNRSGKPREEVLRGVALAAYLGRRARRGKTLDLGMKAVLRLSAG